MKESKMKVEIIGRDWKETIKDVLPEYLRKTEQFGGEYEEREIPIDDGYYLFISDSKDIWKLDRDELVELWEKSIEEEEEEEMKEL